MDNLELSSRMLFFFSIVKWPFYHIKILWWVTSANEKSFRLIPYGKYENPPSISWDSTIKLNSKMCETVIARSIVI